MRDFRALRQVLAVSAVMSAAIVSAAQSPSAAGAMSTDERSYLLSELKSSKAALLTSIKGLSAAQWTFKPSPDAWSIEECTEHLIKAEDLIFDEAMKTLHTPPVARLASATSEGDREVVAQMKDRSKKATAPKVLQPSAQLSNPRSAAQEFERRRDKTIAFVQGTQDSLRIHSGDGPSGSTRDVYQFLLELAAHSARHTAQIREIKSAPNYPGER